MKSKEEIIDIVDFECEIEYLVKLSNSIDSNFQAMVFDYMNKISRKFGESPITDTRSNILFRIQSIMYFTKLMWVEEKSLLSFINENDHIDQNQRSTMSEILVFNQKAIFDSILYHLGSLYDYYAMMTGFIYFGKGLKWNGLIKSAHDKKNSKIGNKQGSLLIDSHREFVNSLFEHRSFLIHNSVSTPGYKFTYGSGINYYTIKIITPQNFVNAFKALKNEIGDKQISLKASLVWLLKYGFKNLNMLLYGMKDELESLRKIEKGKAIITDNRYPDGEASDAYWINE